MDAEINTIWARNHQKGVGLEETLREFAAAFTLKGSPTAATLILQTIPAVLAAPEWSRALAVQQVVGAALKQATAASRDASSKPAEDCGCDK